MADALNNHRAAVSGMIIFVLLAVYVVRQVAWNGLIFDSFSVPKRFEETGLTSDVMANRIGASFLEIEEAAKTKMKKDHLPAVDAANNIPDVEIPGSKLGLRALVEILRSVSPAKHVSGDIVLVGDQMASIDIYVTQSKNRLSPLKLTLPFSNFDAMANSVAESLLGRLNPYVLAVYQYDRQRYDDALRTINYLTHSQETEDRDNRLAVRILWGNILRVKGANTDAIKKYQEALCYDPNDPVAHANWGVALEEQNNFPGAICQLDQAMKLRPKSANSSGYEWIDLDLVKAYYNWGLYLYRQTNYTEAAGKLKKAIELNPSYSHAYSALGIVQWKQEKLSEAIENFKKALKIDRNNEAAIKNLPAIQDQFNQQKKATEMTSP